VGVLDFFGAVDDRELASGLHFWINPLKTMTVMSTRTEVYAASGADQSYEATAKVYQDAPISVLSEDGLRVKVDVAIWFKVIDSDASIIYKTIGTDYVDKIVKPVTRAVIRDATVKYKATDLYQQARSQLAVDIENMIKAEFLKRGIKCEKAALRDIELPPMVADAIQQKLQAQQEAQKMEFKLEKEEKEAERKRIEAKGIKDAQEIINQTLTDEYLSYYYIETLKNLVNSPNNTILILPMDQKLTPLINVGGGASKVVRPPASGD
jgi:regulator of protease activity HflC (stomatin/prohibitin superfamily)